MAVEVGQKMPEFSLYDTEKKKRTLSEFQGKNVVLAFFPGAFTGTCTKELCTFRDRHDQLSNLNAQVVGVTVDSPASQTEWVKQHNIKYPVVSDFNRALVNQLDIALPNMGGVEGFTSAKRSVFVVDKDGVLRYKWVAQAPGEPNYDEIQQELAKLK